MITKDGIFFFFIFLNMMMMFFVGSYYPPVQGLASPICDFAAIGLVTPSCYTPTFGGTGSGAGNNPYDPSLIQAQNAAVDKLTGVSVIGGAITGGLIGFAVGGPVGAGVGALLGGLIVGSGAYAYFSSNPQQAVSASNFLSSLPIIGTLADFAATIGSLLKYPLVLLKFLGDFMIWSFAMISIEPVLAPVMILIESVSLIGFATYIIQLLGRVGVL